MLKSAPFHIPDDLLESILTGSEVGKLDSMLNMVVDDDLDMLGNNGNNSNSGGMSSAMSDDGSSSGSDSLSGSAMSPPPSMAAAAAGNIEIVTHTGAFSFLRVCIPSRFRPWGKYTHFLYIQKLS